MEWDYEDPHRGLVTWKGVRLRLLAATSVGIFFFLLAFGSDLQTGDTGIGTAFELSALVLCIVVSSTLFVTQPLAGAHLALPDALRDRELPEHRNDLWKLYIAITSIVAMGGVVVSWRLFA